MITDLIAGIDHILDGLELLDRRGHHRRWPRRRVIQPGAASQAVGGSSFGKFI